MTEFSLKQLEVFVSAAELGSFTRASQELFLTQSTVSAHITALERTLNVRLFDRGSRRIRLTQEGQRIYPSAKKLLADCRELSQLAQNEAADPFLSLGASTVPAQYLLPDLMSAFLKKHRDVRYLIKRGDSDQIHTLLEQGEIRIGFVGTVMTPEKLEYIPIAEDRLVMVTENTPRFRRLLSNGAWGRELLGEPTVAREEGSGTDRSVAAYLRSIAFPSEKLRIVGRVDNPEAIKSMVSKGVGVSVLSALAVREEVAQGHLLSFEMDPEGLKRSIYMVCPRNPYRPEVEEQFLRFIKSQSAQLFPAR